MCLVKKHGSYIQKLTGNCKTVKKKEKQGKYYHFSIFDHQTDTSTHGTLPFSMIIFSIYPSRVVEFQAHNQKTLNSKKNLKFFFKKSPLDPRNLASVGLGFTRV